MAEHAMFLSALYNPAMRPRPQAIQAPPPVQAAPKHPSVTPPAPTSSSRTVTTTATSSSPRPRELLVVRKQASLTSMKHGVRVLPHTHGRNNSNSPIGPSPLNPTPPKSHPRRREQQQQQQQQGLTLAEIEHLRKLPPPPFPARNSSKTYSDRLSRRIEKVINAISSNAPPPPGGWGKVLDEVNGVGNTRIKKTGDYLVEAIAASAAAQAKAEREKEKERKRSKKKKEKNEEMEAEESVKVKDRESTSSSFQGSGRSSGRLHEHHPVEDDEDSDWQDIINDYAEEDDTVGSLPASSLLPPKPTRGIRKMRSHNRILWEDITRIAQDLQQKLGPADDGMEEIEEETKGDYYDDVSSQTSSRFETRVPSWRMDQEKEGGDGLSSATSIIRVQSNTSLVSSHSRRSSSASANSDSSKPRGPRQLPSFERSPLTPEAIPEVEVAEQTVVLPDIKVEVVAVTVAKDELKSAGNEVPAVELPEVEVKRVRTAKITVEVSPPPSPEVGVAPPLPEPNVEVEVVSRKPVSPVASPKPENAIPPPPSPPRPPPPTDTKLTPAEQSNERRASFGETTILALPTGIIRVRKQKSRAAITSQSTPPEAETSPVVSTSLATASVAQKRFNPISRMFKRLAMPADKPDGTREAAKDVLPSVDSAAASTSTGDSSSTSTPITATPQSAATKSTLMFTPQTSFPEHSLPSLPDVLDTPEAASFSARPVVDTEGVQRSVEAAEMRPTPTIETLTTGTAPLASSATTEAPPVPSKRDTPEYEEKFTKEVLADSFRRGLDRIDRSEPVKTTATTDFENTGFGTDDGGEWFTGPLRSSKLADSSYLGSSRPLSDSSHLESSKALADQDRLTSPLGSSELLADSVDLHSLRRMLATIARAPAKAPGEAEDDPLAVEMSRTSSDGSEIMVIDVSNEELDLPVVTTEVPAVVVTTESAEEEGTVTSTVDTAETTVEAEVEVTAIDELTSAEQPVSKSIVEVSVVEEAKAAVEVSEATLNEQSAVQDENTTSEVLPTTDASPFTTEAKCAEVSEAVQVISSVVTQVEVVAERETIPEPSVATEDVVEVAKSEVVVEPNSSRVEGVEKEVPEKEEPVVMKQLPPEEILLSDHASLTSENMIQTTSKTEAPPAPALDKSPTTDEADVPKTISEPLAGAPAPEKVPISTPLEPTETSTPNDRKGKKVTFDEVDISTVKTKFEEKEEEDEDDDSDDEEEVVLKPILPSSRRSLPSPGTPRSPQAFSRGDDEDPNQWAMRVDEKMRVSSSVVKEEPKTVIGSILKTTQFWGGLR
ncbi:hypothetical protein BJ742DRAFT_771999 [Cladochytrium replicatum]|nr:hypothetical protein BJ742DRAFT_771999 [Cladochytrium replicatum]